MPDSSVATAPESPAVAAKPVTLRDLSPTQWKSGAAAWLGWMFDGLDMHLYTLVATPFVAELLGVTKQDPAVGQHASWIQASFLVGWALGGSVFGRLGDTLGRSRTLVLTILAYAVFTGMSFFAATWWQLLIFRFLAALGIGGEWAVGAALLAETWPKNWRPWLAAILQTGVNIGVMLASMAVFLMADLPPRYVFLIGVLPTFLVLWIRRAVPETDEWHAARDTHCGAQPTIAGLFRGEVRRTTILTLLVCSLTLTAHWAFMFWCSQQLRTLSDIAAWTDGERNQLVSQAMTIVMLASIAGNFIAAWASRQCGYRMTIIGMSLGYCAALVATYSVPRNHDEMLYWLALIGVFQGVFALFSMYLPPLFPTLLRTTGAGFCFNIGRIAAAVGTVAFGTAAFGLFSPIGDQRIALVWAGLLFLPASAIAALLPEGPTNRVTPSPID
jgi:MFS family permease